MATVDSNFFEIQRRAYMWNRNSTLDDEVSSMLWDEDPNLCINLNTPGETKLISMPIGAFYSQSNGALWYKTQMPNVWTKLEAGGAGEEIPYLNLNNLIENGYFFNNLDSWILDASENFSAQRVVNSNSKSGYGVQFYGNPSGAGCKYTYVFSTDAPAVRVSLRGRAEQFFFGAYLIEIRSNDVDQELLIDIGALLTSTESVIDLIVPAIVGKTNYVLTIHATGGMDNAEIDLADILIQPEVHAPKTEIFHNMLPTEINVGGIAVNEVFDNQTMEQMWNRLLYPELFPILGAPSSTFTLTQAGLQEVGALITSLNFISTFDRGTIAPPYSTSGFRSGLPSGYIYTGTGLISNISSLLTHSINVNNYTVVLGEQSWTSSVSYNGGEQPLSNKGNIYDAALAPGQTTAISQTIVGVYPFFGTTINVNIQTKQPLSFPDAIYWQLDMVLEEGTLKQTAWFPSVFLPITGIQFFNTLSNSWEWITGDKSQSLTTFTLTPVQLNINGSFVDYNVYAHVGTLIGERQLRFYTN